MVCTKMIAGTIAAYLFLTPCLIQNHHGVEHTHVSTIDQHIHARFTEHHHSAHTQTHSDSPDQCCEEVVAIAHNPLKQLLMAAVLPTRSIDSENIAPLLEQVRGVRSRDGPLFESAQLYAKTTSIRI